MPVHIANNRRSGADKCLHIGLVNNMAEGAFTATEQQFSSLLDRASGDLSVSLSLYVFPDLPAPDPRYSSTDTLRSTRLDGLIVTGREPRSADLRDESYWHNLTALLEWARANTRSTVWSCLAAHAAVLHLDGIGRQRRAAKRFGVFECEPVSRHHLTSGMPSTLQVPHSRWNGLREAELTSSGYVLLMRSEGGELDTFTKMYGSLFVFSQGHHEYQTDTLLREFRRDFARFLRNPGVSPPAVPSNYFSAPTEQRLIALRDAAEARPGDVSLADVAAALNDATVENTWAASSACLYRNWLQYLVERRDEDVTEQLTRDCCTNNICRQHAVPLKEFH